MRLSPACARCIMRYRHRTMVQTTESPADGTTVKILNCELVLETIQPRRTQGAPMQIANAVCVSRTLRRRAFGCKALSRRLSGAHAELRRERMARDAPLVCRAFA